MSADDGKNYQEAQVEAIGLKELPKEFGIYKVEQPDRLEDLYVLVTPQETAKTKILLKAAKSGTFRNRLLKHAKDASDASAVVKQELEAEFRARGKDMPADILEGIKVRVVAEKPDEVVLVLPPTREEIKKYKETKEPAGSLTGAVTGLETRYVLGTLQTCVGQVTCPSTRCNC